MSEKTHAAYVDRVIDKREQHHLLDPDFDDLSTLFSTPHSHLVPPPIPSQQGYMLSSTRPATRQKQPYRPGVDPIPR